MQDRYTKYCSEFNILPAAASVIGKSIIKLFPNVCPKFCCLERRKVLKYCGLAHSSTSDDKALSVPEHCTLERSGDSLILTIPTCHLLENKSVCAVFTINVVSGALKLRLTEMQVDVSLAEMGIAPTVPKVSQSQIDGLIRIISCATVCTGQQWKSEMKYKSIKTETWSMLGQKDSSCHRVRSLKCNGILHFNAINSESCAPCIRVFLNCRIVRKRQALRDMTLDDQNIRPAGKKPMNCRSDTSCTNSTASLSLISENDTVSGCSEVVPSAIPSNSESVPEEDNLSDNTILLHQDDHADLVEMIKKLHGDIPSNFATLVQSQLKNATCSDKDPRYRRWDPAVISVCLSLWCRSPHAYKQLKKSDLLVLPSGRLLQYYKNSVKQTPGFNSDNLHWMWKEAKDQGIPTCGWHGGIVIDEMQIQEDIQVGWFIS